MAVTIDGDGTITGVSVGGLPDGIVDTDMLAADAVTDAKQSLSGAAKAWVKFTVSGGTPSIADDFNVASLTDHGTGDISVNFTNNMANTNYAAVCTTEITDNNVHIPFTDTNGKSTSAIRLGFFRVVNFTGGGNSVDPASADVVIFGD